MTDAALGTMALRQETVCHQEGPYTITLSATGPGVAELYTASAGAGERVYFLADPEPGYRVSFEKCGYYMEQMEMKLYYVGRNVYEIVMPDGDVMLDLRFVPIESDSHPVTVSVCGDGMATVSQTSAKAGESIFLELIAAPNAKIGTVRASSGGRKVEVYPLGRLGGAELYEIFMPDGALEIAVEFCRYGPYPVEAVVVSGPEGAGGSLELSHTEACEGDTVTVTAHPDRGWEVLDITTRRQSQLTRIGKNVWSFVMPRYGEEILVSFAKTSYPVTVAVEEPVGGTAVTDVETAVIGQRVRLACIPDEGYRVARIEGPASLTEIGGGLYSFVMSDGPAALSVLFLRENNPFLDVNESHYYHDSVLWALEQGITNGLSADIFGPDEDCSRAQVVTFLWRAAGCPAAGGENPFSDVAPEDWYADAVLWAVENGITMGLTADTFGPEEVCSRAQTVTFLWRAMGCPESSAEHPFADVEAGSWYEMPVLWALENGITTGMSATAFGPGAVCSRAQVVVFLYRTDKR
jgi:hypothetical protein